MLACPDSVTATMQQNFLVLGAVAIVIGSNLFYVIITQFPIKLSRELEFRLSPDFQIVLASSILVPMFMHFASVDEFIALAAIPSLIRAIYLVFTFGGISWAFIFVQLHIIVMSLVHNSQQRAISGLIASLLSTLIIANSARQSAATVQSAVISINTAVIIVDTLMLILLASYYTDERFMDERWLNHAFYGTTSVVIFGVLMAHQALAMFHRDENQVCLYSFDCLQHISGLFDVLPTFPLCLLLYLVNFANIILLPSFHSKHSSKRVHLFAMSHTKSALH